MIKEIKDDIKTQRLLHEEYTRLSQYKTDAIDMLSVRGLESLDETKIHIPVNISRLIVNIQSQMPGKYNK